MNSTTARPLTATELDLAARMGDQVVARLRDEFAVADQAAERYRAAGYYSDGRIVRRREPVPA